MLRGHILDGVSSDLGGRHRPLPGEGESLSDLRLAELAVGHLELAV